MHCLWLHFSESSKHVLFNIVTLTSKFAILYANFWLGGDMAFIFHMCIACDNTFPKLLYFLTSWPWFPSLNYLMLTFDWEVIWLSKFICALYFLTSRPWPPSLTYFMVTFHWDDRAFIFQHVHCLCVFIVTSTFYQQNIFHAGDHNSLNLFSRILYLALWYKLLAKIHGF